MNKKDVIAYFDKFAPKWDEDLIANDSIINKILDGAKVKKGHKVLDVACGTGVMIPYYKNRSIIDITAIDISSEMAKICQNKFPDIKVICGDVEETPLNVRFDNIVIYNAFPHFPNPENLIKTLSNYLNIDGTLTVAHGMSKASLDKHHEGSASKVSIKLLEIDELEKIFEPYFKTLVKISDDNMYQLTGILKEK